MPTVLVFTVAAPLAAMGDIAIGERRYGGNRPAKSAILGLIAAALGIDRSDEGSHAALARDYGYAVRVAENSPLIEDYHTVQVPPAKRDRRWATRRQELAEPELDTILSLRDYRADAYAVVALWVREGIGTPIWPLQVLADALRRPHYTLYFGRKGCPLGRPPAPAVIEAATLKEAFATYEREEDERSDHSARHLGGTVYADLEARAWLGGAWREDRVVRRRDEIASRRRWQFGLRDELVAVASTTEGDA